MTSAQAAWRFFLILLAVTTVLVAMVVRPIGSALFMAAVLAGVLWPLHRRLCKRLWGRAGASAGAIVFAVLLLLVGPVVAFSTFAIKEGTDGARYVSKIVRSDGVIGLVNRLPAPFADWARRGIDQMTGDEGADLDRTVQDQMSAQGRKAAAAVGGAIVATGSMIFQATMMLIALFFLLAQGEELVAWLDGVSPLQPGQTRELLLEFKKVSFAVIMSTVITAGVQATAALIGFLIAHVPHPVFFAGVAFFMAFIPAIGAAVVCLAAALLLYATGHPYYALFLAAWGLVVVGLVDNIVKPFLIKAGMEMRGGVVFFALVGGLGAFGTVGLLLGPLVIALFLALLRIYERDFKPGQRPDAARSSS
jgi:predicted PurR-regulated permease PerM